MRPLTSNVGRVNINAGRAEVRIERQRLVQLVGDVQADVLVDAAVVGVEVLVVPLEALAGRLFLVVPGVVDAHGDDVLAGAAEPRR